MSTFHIESLLLHPHSQQPQAAIHYQLTLPHYASKAGRRLFLPLNTLHPLTTNLTKTKRTQPILISDGYTKKLQATIHLPEGYQIEALPELATFQSPCGQYTAQTKKSADGRSITYQRTLQINRTKILPSQYQAVLAFYEQIAQQDNLQAVLVRPK